MLPGQADEGLCHKCNGLDFFTIFGPEARCGIIAPIAIRDAIANEHICVFCKFLVTIGRKIIDRPFYVTERNGVDMKFLFERRWKAPVRDALGSIVSGGGSLSVRIWPAPSPFDSAARIEFYLCPMWLDEDKGWHSLSTRFVLENEIDLSLCRRWLMDCEGTHATACREVLHFSSDLPPDFRVVDVQDECIVSPPAGCRYVALSYVWGQIETLCLTQEDLEWFECPGVLDKHALANAKTILDAMSIVSKMGERYLWVDRLCIIQDSPTKAAQLRAMDVIYGAALLTLVAADGPDANAGLRGITPGSRSLPQHTEVINDDLALTVSCPAPTDLRLSAWSSRGWTCQEQLLSRKFLIFSGGQVMWQCGSCFLCEDTEGSNKAGPLTRLEQVEIDVDVPKAINPGAVFFQPTHLFRPKIFTQYASIVRGFTKRHLTYQDDVLPAFQGFGSILERSFNCKFIAGLPEAYLDQALLWLPAVMQKRRTTSAQDCPSWSWAGWIGESRYDDTEDDNRERVVPVIKWHVIERSSILKQANGTGIGLQESNFGLPRTLNTFLWIPLFDLLSGRIHSTPSIHHTTDTGPYLHFWTSCAFFRITLRPSPPDQNNASKNPPLRALINSASGPYAGHVVLNGSGPTELVPGRHEFVVVSEAQLTGYDAVRSMYRASERCEMWNVLLVEWDERGGAERVGAGRVSKRAWSAAGPVVKFVELG
ncbi:hypothetical protein PRZ48_007686 [Zasmidium cellare]|uniref:Heterokaryon incompatibility domain-containing protein n=1 Tax=Zasmidium cellare TaxID=395010 RepID=A0ABR0EK57_ZASCE|nr:hypothetical protein PRZ48_007686 [Zasmidium cellare]